MWVEQFLDCVNGEEDLSSNLVFIALSSDCRFDVTICFSLQLTFLLQLTVMSGCALDDELRKPFKLPYGAFIRVFYYRDRPGSS